ncbi:VOC family protein [Nonomuraea sp. NPDC048826]|uniref:VOC family protein n=1 Tax=Nonomuraea sp. NPDC048826 TaxID=3364347 RepID=UPI003720B017
MTAKAGLSQINIVVSDLDASIAFYEKLGLTFSVDAGQPSHATCELPDGTFVMLDTEEAVTRFTPGWTRPTGGPRVAFGFGLPTAKAVDALYEELVAAGHPSLREPWSSEWGVRYATVVDPDGTPADLQAPLDGS